MTTSFTASSLESAGLQWSLSARARNWRTCSPVSSALTLEQLDAPCLLDFLEHLETDRKNSARSRNARLAALRSFARFVEYRVGAHANGPVCAQ